MLKSIKSTAMDYGNRIPFHRTMNLFIETLTGTCFELRVSPFETVLSVKAKIQRLEGIPISQQHLIWEGAELDDDYCLHDYRIKDSCMLKLVLAMRGGPINTRRIAMDDTSLLDMADYIDINHEDLLEELSLSPPVGKPDNNSQVTLLVYRNGDQINFFRVVDRGGDGAITPVSESFSGASFADVEDLNGPAHKQKRSLSRLMENRITASKMKHLQGRLHDLNVKENVRHNPSTVTYDDHPKQKAYKNEGYMEALTTSNKVPELSDKVLSDLDRRSPRTERLLRVLNSQRFSTNSKLQPDGSSSAKPKPPSNGLTSKMSFNRHDMYLRSYGLQPMRKPSQEEEESSWEKPLEASGDVKIQSTSSTSLSLGTTKDEFLSSKPWPAKESFWGGHSNTSDFKRQNFDSRNPEPKVNILSRLTSTSSKVDTDFLCQTVSNKDLLPSSNIITPMPPHLKNSERLPNLRSAGRRFTSTSKVANNLSQDCNEIGRNSSLSKTRNHFSDCKENTVIDTLDKDTPRTLPGNLHCQRKQSERYLPNSATAVSSVANNRRLEYEKDITSIDVDCLRMMSRYSQKPSHSPTILPPVRPLVLKKKRCVWCGKKTGLATSYICRCGKNFCATHRYAETHNCTFDYKSSGRQLLKDNNPIVTAPKLPKI